MRKRFVKWPALIMAGLTAVTIPVTAMPVQALEPPSERVILEVTGNISEFNGDAKSARFDRPMLEGLGFTEIVTETPWTDGSVRFEGVLVRDLLHAVGAKGMTVTAVAINDYAVEIPISDFETYPVILALKMNGEFMSVRKKGPLWVIYPWGDEPDLRNEVYHSRAIWQLKLLTVK